MFKTFEKCLPKNFFISLSSGLCYKIVEKKAKCFWIEIVLKARLMEWKIHKNEKLSSTHTYTLKNVEEELKEIVSIVFLFGCSHKGLMLLGFYLHDFERRNKQKKVFILFGVIELWHFESFPLLRIYSIFFCMCGCFEMFSIR